MASPQKIKQNYNFPLIFKLSVVCAHHLHFYILIFSNYKLFLVAIITFLIIALSTKLVSLGSISAAVMVFIANFIPFFQDCFIFKYNELNPEIIGSKLPWFIYMICIAFLALLLIFRHINNIKRLIKKEEKKFSFGKYEKK